MFASLGCLLIRRRTLDVWVKIQNDFTDISGVISERVGVTKIRFWSLTVSCIFHNVRYAVAILVIIYVYSPEILPHSGTSCKQSAVLFLAVVCLTAASIDEHFVCLFMSFFFE